jgi:hypothetical protein
MKSLLIRTLGLVIGFACLQSCTAVKPWERGILAKPQMALNPLPKQRSLSEHVYRSREASSGGDSAQGGGCGCE